MGRQTGRGGAHLGTLPPAFFELLNRHWRSVCANEPPSHRIATMVSRKLRSRGNGGTPVGERGPSSKSSLENQFIISRVQELFAEAVRFSKETCRGFCGPPFAVRARVPGSVTMRLRRGSGCGPVAGKPVQAALPSRPKNGTSDPWSMPVSRRTRTVPRSPRAG